MNFLIRILPFENRKQATKAALLFSFFFLVIAAFWTLKPMRTSGVVKAFGPAYYPIFKQGVLVIAPLLMLAFAFLSNRLSRERLVYTFCIVFVLLSWVFWGLFQFSSSQWVSAGFFFFVDAYITVMIVTFFSYLNDVYVPNEAKKFYGLIGLGGLLGGIVGSGVSGWMSEYLGHNIILCVTFFLGAIVLCVRKLGKLIENDPESVIEIHSSEIENDGSKGSIFDGMRLVFQSRYLWSIAIIVGTYEVASTIIDFQFNSAADSAYGSRDSLAAFQGKVFFAANLCALFVQTFLTSWVNQRKSILYGLLFLPAALFLGSVAYLFLPFLAIITLTIGAEASFAYSIQQTTREILYTPLSKKEKYESKAFIDMIVIRGSKALGATFAVVYALRLQEMGFNHTFLMGVNIALIALWLWATFNISRLFDKRTESVEVESPPVRKRA